MYERELDSLERCFHEQSFIFAVKRPKRFLLYCGIWICSKEQSRNLMITQVYCKLHFHSLLNVCAFYENDNIFSLLSFLTIILFLSRYASCIFVKLYVKICKLCNYEF